MPLPIYPGVIKFILMKPLKRNGMREENQPLFQEGMMKLMQPLHGCNFKESSKGFMTHFTRALPKTSKFNLKSITKRNCMYMGYPISYGNVKSIDKVKFNLIGVLKKCISKVTPTKEGLNEALPVIRKLIKFLYKNKNN